MQHVTRTISATSENWYFWAVSDCYLFKGPFFFNFKGFLNMHLVSGFRLLAFIIQIVCNLAILLAK